MIPTKSGLKIEQLKRKSGKELLKEYEGLDKNDEWLIECYKRALIEKYAKEINYEKE